MWVAGTGAFLLLVAAAVFVAANWEQIPSAAKLAAIGLLCGGFLLAGRAFRSTVPGTAGTMFHLGAFLIPVNVAAVGVHLGLGWEALLLIEGLTAAVAFRLLAQVEDSVVLRWAAAAAVVVAAGGIGAVSDIPAPLVLAASAAVALLVGAERPAIGWALVVGLSPAVATAETLISDGVPTLVHLGLAGNDPRFTAVLSGLIAAAVLVVSAQRRRQLVFAVAGAISAVLGFAVTWEAAAPGADAGWMAAAVFFLLAELTAVLLRRDDFWGPPARLVAAAGEVIGGGVAILGLFALAVSPFSAVGSMSPIIGTALLVSVAAWFIADLRRVEADSTSLPMTLLVGSGWPVATAPAAISLAAAIAVLAGPIPAAVAIAVLGAAMVVSGRPLGHAAALAGAVAAPMLAYDTPVLAAAIALTGGFTLAWAAVLRARSDPDRAEPVWLLGLVSLLPLAVVAPGLLAAIGTTATVLAAMSAMWAIAAVLDQAETSPDLAGLGLLARGLSVPLLFVASTSTPADALLIAGTLSALTIAEVLRRRDPVIALIGAVALPATTMAAGLSAGLDPATSGLIVATIAAFAGGAATLTSARWYPALATLGAISLAWGGWFALAEPRTTAQLVLLTSGLVIAAGLWFHRNEIALVGGIGAVIGVWINLGLSEVTWSEAFTAPVALLLVLVGIAGSRRGVSSWMAYGPAVVLLGGTALVELASTGEPGHALIAGLVGFTAVVIGGWKRLAGPLFLGTALLIATTGYQSLAVTATIPTWAWLAAGGALLLGSGIAMERTSTGPVESGRRIVETIAERFD